MTLSYRIVIRILWFALIFVSWSNVGWADPRVVEARDIPLGIPIADGSGRQWAMQGHMCVPREAHKPGLVLINHGSPASAADRPGMLLAGCHSEAVQWFLRHHRAVALLLRLGYGRTGGPWTEGYDGCANADFYKAGIETARQIGVMVDYLAALPDIDPDDMIVVGQSAGGWGALAYASMSHPHVGAFIVMAGGRGGHYLDKPDSNCHPDRLVDAASRFGRSATTPVLWIVSRNDSYFGPALAGEMADAFKRSGGAVEFRLVDAFGDDGHHLFFGRDGSQLWGPLVETFLDTPRTTSAPGGAPGGLSGRPRSSGQP